jgi:hypothetical protein
VTTPTPEHDGEPRARQVSRDRLFAFEGIVFVALVVVMFALFMRVLILRSAPLPPVVIVSGGSPMADDGARFMRAVAIDPARERMVDMPLALEIEGRVLASTGGGSDGVHLFVVPARAERVGVVVDGVSRPLLSSRALPSPMVRMRGVPWSRDVHGELLVPIYPLRARASSFVDTQAVVVDGQQLDREVLTANPGRIVDKRGRMLPIERSEVDVQLPAIVPPGDVLFTLRAREGAPVFVDVLVIDTDDVASMVQSGPARELPARVHSLVDVMGGGADTPVAHTLTLEESVRQGSVLLVVAKSGPYPKSRGLAFAAIVDDDTAHASALLLAMIRALLPDDPLAAFARREPGLVDDDVRRALLSRLAFEPEGLPALGEAGRDQMTEAKRGHDAAVERGRVLFRAAASAVFLWVIAIALHLVWRARRSLVDMGLTEPDDVVAPRDRTAIMALLAVVGVGATLFGLDAVTRLAT